ncbi:MAG: DUF1552 domain-containing protein [Acidobacteria bacterium]|nr:DUF1552 domain-containing protein [Acidobacteriota bacterium]
MPHRSSRRFFLRSSGVNLALPFLDSIPARILGSGLAVTALTPAATEKQRPVRLVCIGNALGFYPPAFFPQRTGKDYELPSLLQPLAPHRGDLTIYSGLDHGVTGGHFAIHSFLSGVRANDAKGMPEGNITVDQRAAETIGGVTRFPALTVGSEDGIHGGCMMSWSRSGTRVPPIQNPRELFRKLFVDEAAADVEKTKDQLSLQGSILDSVRADARSLKNQLGKRDQQKLDEYFTSVRDVERGIELRRQWVQVPKPKPGMKEPVNAGLVNDIPVLYDLIALALQTDSTRIATFEIAGGFEASVLGVRKEYHALSHHGQVQESIDLLLKLERYQMEQFARFLAKLKSIEDGDGNLLQHSMVLFGSGMGNGNSHTNRNLPIVLAGGGFRHGEHQSFPQNGAGRTQLCNLFLSMLHRFGVQVPRFGLSTGTLRGLELA